MVLVVYTIDARRLARELRRLGVSYRVPRGPEDLECREGEVFLVEKGLEEILPPGQQECRRIVVEQGASPVHAVMAVLEALRGGFGEIVVGIDPGQCYAYVVVADELLVDYGYACSLEELAERLCSLLSSAKALSKTVKVGDRGGLEAARALASCGLRVVLVDEEQSTRGTPVPGLRGLPRPLSRDVKAALRIALREGYLRVEG